LSYNSLHLKVSTILNITLKKKAKIKYCLNTRHTQILYYIKYFVAYFIEINL